MSVNSTRGPCAIADCSKPSKLKDRYCSMHAARRTRRGDPLAAPVVERPEAIEGEEWRPIVGYEDFYAVSNLGRVVRTKRYLIDPGLLTPKIEPSGYTSVALSRASRVVTFRIHRLVCRAFLGEPAEGLEVNHIDGNKANNRLTNLEYVSPSQNTAHAWRTGLRKRR